jgi:hypothetical protein
MNAKFWGNVGLGAVLVCLVAFAVTKISASSGVEGLLLPEVKVSDSTSELLHSVELVRSAVMLQKTGHKVEAAFAIENRGGHDIKNISILCTLFDAAGKEQGRDKWIVFDTVKAEGHGMFTFSDKRFISDSAVRSLCQIVDLEVAKAPLITVHRGSAGHGGQNDKSGAAEDSGHGAKH